MTDRKLLALLTAATLTMAVLTGASTFGLFADSEDVSVQVAGNISTENGGGGPNAADAGPGAPPDGTPTPDGTETAANATGTPPNGTTAANGTATAEATTTDAPNGTESESETGTSTTNATAARVTTGQESSTMAVRR